MWAAFSVSFSVGDAGHSVIVGLFAPDKAVIEKGLALLASDGVIKDLSIEPVDSLKGIGPAAFWVWYGKAVA
jgi:hypothetical protein